MTSLDDILLAESPSYRDFCAQVVISDGRSKGRPYDPSSHPAQDYIISQLDAGRYRRIAWAKPVQDGGTLVAMAALFRRAVCDRQAVLLAYPTGDLAKDIWTTKVWPVLDSFGGLEPEAGGGSRGGAARVVTLPTGGRFFLRSAGGRGESGQASVTGDVLLVDEVDDWEDMNRIELIRHRITNSVDKLELYCSTVKSDGEVGSPEGSKILALVESGTDSHLEFPCPACGGFNRYRWAMVDQERHVIRCPCGHQITERERLESLPKYRVKHKNPSSDFLTLRWTVLDSPRHSIYDMVTLYHAAARFASRGDHGLLRAFFRDRLAEQYTADKLDDDAPAVLTRHHLVSRSSTSRFDVTVTDSIDDGHSRHLCSNLAGFDYVTVGADVQRGG
jgi:predicted RNA-binding Zn-ribbon protein involved in translation (DUF1610 family)